MNCAESLVGAACRKCETGGTSRQNRPVAVKLLYPVFTADPVNRQRFENEARAAASLSHPHIVTVLDSGDDDGTPFIVMERLSGRTLADVIDRGPLPQARVQTVVDDVLSALAAAHGAGILHRDVKPANILFTDAGDVKVADFGIAKTSATPHTMTGQIVGTMAYLSADRIAGRPATVEDDLYAVGAVGYEALTGRRPFPQDNFAELARAISDGAPAPLARVRPDVAPGLAAGVERAMSRDPRWRFHSANAMRAALAGRAPLRPPTKVMAAPLPEPATMTVPTSSRRSRTRMLLGVAAALAATVIAAAAVIADSASRTPTPEPAGTTSTSVPAPATPSVLPPQPTPTLVDQGQGRNEHRENGRGNRKPKPKGVATEPSP